MMISVQTDGWRSFCLNDFALSMLRAIWTSDARKPLISRADKTNDLIGFGLDLFQQLGSLSKQ